MRNYNPLLLKSILLSVIILSLLSCQPSKKIKIGFCLDSFEQSRWHKDSLYFATKAREMGNDVLITVANGNQEVQNMQAEELLEKGVDILVIVPVDHKVSAEIVKNAHTRNVKVISYDRLIKNCNVDFYISFDNIKVGEQMASYVVNQFPKANVVILNGPTTDNNSLLYKTGILNILQPNIEKGDIKILSDYYAKCWSIDEGARMTDEFLKKQKTLPDAIIAQNDALAEGVVKTLRNNNLDGKILVTGQDAELSALQRINSGSQSVTIYKPIKLLAFAAVELANKLVKNEKITGLAEPINNGKKLVPSILLTTKAVDKKNLESTIIKDGFYSAEEITGKK
jgi:D-xylose transport system substrate-binding protein